MLSACSTSEPDTAKVETIAALQAVGYTQALMNGINTNQPSSMIGVYMTAFLMHTSRVTYRTALDGIEAQMNLHISQEQQISDTYTLLQDLGSALKVDIMDLLDRSNERGRTLDTYLTSLEELTNRSLEKQQQLEDQLDSKQDERRAKSKEVSALQSEQNRALRDKDFNTAGVKQQQLTTESQTLSVLQSQADELDDTIRIFKDLIEVAKERHNAISSNRDAVLKGVEVVDVPGIEDIGVIRDESGEERRNRRDSQNSPFGNINP